MRHVILPPFVDLRLASLSLPLSLALTGGFASIAAALPLDQLNQIAQKITVQIDGERPGSGVIIRHKGQAYTVLTAKHLVAVQDHYAVIAPDGQRYPIAAKTIVPLPETDLAIVEFRSQRQYSVAQLANYSPTNQQYLFLSGFPAPSEGGVTEQIRLFIPGQVVPFERAMLVSADPLSQGYRLFYNNIADPGMSGGAVLDTDGHVVGIHGRSDGEDVEDIETGRRRRLRLGLSAGLPMRWLLQQHPELQLTATTRPPAYLSSSEAIAVAQSIRDLTLTPSGELNALTWANYANLLYRTNRLPEALKAINKSLEIKFQFPQFWYAQGLILLEMQQYQDALNAFDRSIKLQPQFYRAWKSKAMTLVRMQQPQAAIAATDTALKFEEQSAVMWFLRGNILSHNLQDFMAAVESFDRAIAVEPDFAAAWTERGRALQQLNRPAEALASVKQALKMDPSDRTARALAQSIEKSLEQ
jgi:tetratricopeptide (TPR) repeat protein